ncbi:MAG: hypothetical protein DRP45_08390 [Candidatus Zixiibacteriota bacterium]|nr:MAG: hypothetical protein DRP45_08390 [candidate division Zixibacteria bacterium]
MRHCREKDYDLTRRAYPLTLIFIAVLILASIMAGCNGDDNPVDPGQPPVISVFVAAPSTITVGESSVITYKVSRADSVRLVPPETSLVPTDSGQTPVTPAFTTTYSLVAYNKYGKDSASTIVSLTGIGLEAVNGLYYKGEMNSSVQTPLLQFRAAGDTSLVTPNTWASFSIIEGDGTLTSDSGLIDDGQIAQTAYDFSGSLGHAVVRAIISGTDTLDVQVRANTIIPGTNGQAQYVLLSDTYADVKHFNGDPYRVDYPPQDPDNSYAVYEDTEGLVVAVEDTELPWDLIQDNEPVDVILITGVLAGCETADGIGIGSPILDVRTVFGVPYVESLMGDAYFLRYLDEGLDFYTDTTGDSLVVELHLRKTAKTSEAAPPRYQYISADR